MLFTTAQLLIFYKSKYDRITNRLVASLADALSSTQIHVSQEARSGGEATIRS